MGDPFFFSIKGGANPHTRNLFGIKKQVDRNLAIKQWHYLADVLLSHGLQIFVIPPQIEYPGLVYPANAGFLAKVQQHAPLIEKGFYLSNLIPTRSGEEFFYKDFIENIGIPTYHLSKRFEGEADFFPAGNKYIFTYGKIKQQRFRLKWGFPPYQRVYGFRSDFNVLTELEKIINSIPIIPLELINESYYHGDTIFSSFGENKQYLLVFMEGLSKDSQTTCKKQFGDHLIPLSENDAKLYSTNSFQTTYQNENILFLPKGVSDQLIHQVKERGAIPVQIDVSEFLKKGGGSIKCMIGDLGIFYESADDIKENVKEYREKYRYENYYKKI